MKVGVVLPITEQEELGRHLRYAEIREIARAAEHGGLDSVWVFDHLIIRSPEETEGMHEAWTILSAVAADTSRVELGTIVLAMPFRDPSVLAKMAAALDDVSDGRLILGVGTGWHEPEFDAFGFPFDHRVDRFEEGIRVLTDLLRDGRSTFDGRYYRTRDAVLIPRGPRPGGPPILIASKGPRMNRLTGRYADSWNAAWMGRDPTRLIDRRAALEAACRDVGRDPSTIEITAGLTVRMRPTRKDEPDALEGTPEEIADGLRRYAELGVGHAICSLSPVTPETVTRLAEAASLSRTAAVTR